MYLVSSKQEFAYVLTRCVVGIAPDTAIVCAQVTVSSSYASRRLTLKQLHNCLLLVFGFILTFNSDYFLKQNELTGSFITQTDCISFLSVHK